MKPKLGQAMVATGRLERALDCFVSAPADPDSAIGLKILTALADGRDPRESLPAGRGWDRVLAAAGR